MDAMKTSDNLRNIVDNVAKLSTWALVRSDAKQVPAMRELEKKGVTFVRWKQSDLDKLKVAWDEVVKEKSASDPLFGKITKSYQAFRDDYSIWAKNAYLN